MNKGYSTRSRALVSAVAAVAVTTAIASSLVASFDPAQLLRIQGESAPAQIAAIHIRSEATGHDA